MAGRGERVTESRNDSKRSQKAKENIDVIWKRYRQHNSQATFEK